MASAGYRNMVGRQDLVGRKLVEALPEIAGQGFVALLDEVLASGNPYIGRGTKVSFNRGGGAAEEIYVDFVYEPIRDVDGSVSGISCQGHDVTEAVQLSEGLCASRTELAAALATIQAIFCPPSAPMRQFQGSR